MNVPAFDFMHPVKKHIFCPVIYFILLCISAVSVMLILSISAYFSLSLSYFACLHLFLMFLLNVLHSIIFFGIIFPHFFIIPSISSAIHFLFSCLYFFRMRLFTDFTRASLNIFHFKFPVRLLHLFLTLPAYISLQIWLFSVFWI